MKTILAVKNATVRLATKVLDVNASAKLGLHYSQNAGSRNNAYNASRLFEGRFTLVWAIQNESAEKNEPQVLKQLICFCQALGFSELSCQCRRRSPAGMFARSHKSERNIHLRIVGKMRPLVAAHHGSCQRY
ncbi:MAG: hypothetical protein AABN95_14970 [Acidobacteriota bacterium]